MQPNHRHGSPDTDGQVPQLLPLEPLPRPALQAPILVAVGLLTAIAAGSLFARMAWTPPASQMHSTEVPRIVGVAADRVAGAFVLMDQQLAIERPHLVTALGMPERERQRVQDALREGRVRIAAVTLWDTYDEDADIVELSAAGFVQQLTITHREKTYFLPVIPGGTVRIVGVKDGGGGGITLGVKTLLGPLMLPPLGPGQILEIPAL